MIYGYSRAEVAEKEKPLVAQADKEQGADALMRQAAHALYIHTHREISRRDEMSHHPPVPLGERHIVVLVGAGNNGGDGLYAASYMSKRGYSVTILPTNSNMHQRGAEAASLAGAEIYQPLEKDNVEAMLRRIFQLNPVCLVDAIIGIGAEPPLRQPALALVQGLNDWMGRLAAAKQPVPLIVACDHPSGMSLSTSASMQPDNAVLPADLTVTMGAAKTGMLLGSAKALIGKLEIHEIGLPVEHMEPQVGMVTREDVSSSWPWPLPEDHKYSRGVLSILAGSSKYPGAGILVSKAAVQCGASFVRYLGETQVQDLVVSSVPEVVLTPGRTDALVMGCGLEGNNSDHRKQMLRVWERRTPELPTLLDAGAISLVGDKIKADENCLLTPHCQEAVELAQHLGMKTSCSEISAQPYFWAKKLSEAVGCTVLLKGAGTVIYSPERLCLSMNHGTADLATAGSGDVLAGIIGFLLAVNSRKKNQPDINVLAGIGAWVHAEVGRRASPTPSASRMIETIYEVVSDLR